MQAGKIQKAACVGSGVIGTAWALNFAWKGLTVSVYDIGQPQLDAAQKTMDTNLKTLESYQLLTAEEAQAVKDRVHYTTDLAEALSGAQFIQESGPENYEIKGNILRQIEEYAADDVIIASSTSGLLITQLAQGMNHPERLVGGHPYNPPHLIPLVEIVKGESSSSEAAQTAYDFYKQLGKEPVILNKEVSGFISNRLQVALYREAIDLVVNGVCSIEDVDKAALYGPGLRWGIMGPNLIFHLGAGPAGLGVFVERQRESVNLRLSQMADWKEMPQAFVDMAEDGIREAIEHREPGTGKTYEELVQYRDSMLIELLKLHGKV